MIKYSICSTTYNIATRIRKSLDSLLKYINEEEWEIVVVDNRSKDGTYEILEEYASKFKNFKMVSKRCKRGRGRNIAYKNSEGKYIIVVDFDTIYYKQWYDLIKAYNEWEGRDKYALHSMFLGIYPRHLIEEVGGWRNLQLGEDFDMWWRLIQIDAFKWCPIVAGENWNVKEPESRQAKNSINILVRKFIAEKDRYIARSEYKIKDRMNEISEWATEKSYYLFWMPVEFLAKISSLFYFTEKRDPGIVRKLWYNNMLDFPQIEGKRNTKFISFPKGK